MDGSQDKTPVTDNNSDPNEIIAEGEGYLDQVIIKAEVTGHGVWLNMQMERDGEIKDGSRNLTWANSST